MKFSLTIISLFLSSLVVSVDLSFFPGQQVLDDDKGGDVPGENPLTFCKADHGDDILELEHVNLDPNPPLKGQTLTIDVAGTLKEDIEKGAYVELQVKYGLIRLVSTKADLCEQVSNVDLECPIQKGKAVITKDVDLPKEIPPGKYTVFADAYTVDDRKIVCLEATVQFT